MLSLPSSWDRGDLSFRAYFLPSTNSSGNIVFRMRTAAIGDGDLENTAWGEYRSVSTPNNTASDSVDRINISDESGDVSVSSASDHDLLWVEVSRDTSDSYTGTAYLLAIKVYYTIDRATEV